MVEKSDVNAPSAAEPRPNAKPPRSPGGRRSRPKSVDVREVEWRFEAPDLDAVEGWLVGRENSEGPGLSVSPEGGTKKLSDSYHDTEDWRVYRSGYALRVREVEGGAETEVTLKSLASEGGEAGEERRREITEVHKGGRDAVVEAARGSKGPVGEFLRNHVGARAIHEVFALRTNRRTFDLVLREALENDEPVEDASGNIRAGDAPELDDTGPNGATDGRVSVDAEGNIREAEPGDEDTEDSGDTGDEIVVDAEGNIRATPDEAGEEPSDEVGEEPSDEAQENFAERVVGEVALDRTEILLGDGEEASCLTRVEVEADAREAEAAPELLGEFVAQMRSELGLKPTSLSKYAAGLFATGRSPEAASDLGPTRIDETVTLGELAFAILRRQFAKMRAHEAGTRSGEDPEDLHDMRVATRRMRAAIKLFKDVLPERAQHLRDELKWVATSLGDVRDPDVQLERLEGWSSGAEDEAYRDALRRAARTLERQREEARGRMHEDLDSTRYERFETSFAEMLRLGQRVAVVPGAPRENRAADELAVVAGRDLLSRRYRKWRKLADGIKDSSVPEDYHELRKEGKRLRYALEFFSEIYAGGTDGLVKRMKTLQDDLGLHQDDIVAFEWLREMATGGHRFPSRAAFFVGMLAGEFQREAAEIRDGLRENKTFRAVADGKEWKKVDKVMSKAASDTAKGKKKSGKKK